MYAPSNMKMQSLEQAYNFIEEYSFGLIVSAQLQGSHVPFILQRKEGTRGVLYCHFSKNNPHWRELDNTKVLIVFSGPNAYISPTWYAKGPAVPTWNYVAVHVLGKVKLLASSRVYEILQQMISKYEPNLLAENDPELNEYKNNLMNGIVVAKILISKIDGIAKLGQCRTNEDQIGITKGLAASKHFGSKELLKYMLTFSAQHFNPDVNKAPEKARYLAGSSSHPRVPDTIGSTVTQANNLSKSISFSIPYFPPYDWTSILNFYESHQVIGVDKIIDQTYERFFKIDDIYGLVKVKPDLEETKLVIKIYTENPKILPIIIERTKRMFDVDLDPAFIANAFKAHPFMYKLWKKYPGLRVPQSWDPFETTICSVLGQFVSIKAARSFIAQLVENYGECVPHPLTKENAFIFPTAEKLAMASLEEIKTTNVRKQTIRDIAKLTIENAINFSIPQDLAVARAKLLEIRGIGPWTADYICLRALSDTDAFPKTDLVLKRVLEKHPDIDLEKLQPWRSYAAIYLWKEYHTK